MPSRMNGGQYFKTQRKPMCQDSIETYVSETYHDSTETYVSSSIPQAKCNIQTYLSETYLSETYVSGTYVSSSIHPLFPNSASKIARSLLEKSRICGRLFRKRSLRLTIQEILIVSAWLQPRAAMCPFTRTHFCFCKMSPRKRKNEFVVIVQGGAHWHGRAFQH